MSDYISRKAAEVAFCNYMGATSGRVALMAEQIFNPIPAADVVEVVRCQQCKGWMDTTNSELGLCVLTKRVVTGRDYCSEGKRKDGAVE